MIKIFVSVLTLYNSQTDGYRTTVVMTESTYEQCVIDTLEAGKAIINQFGGYNKILVECTPIEKL